MLVQLGKQREFVPAGPARVLFINTNRFKLPWPVTPFGMCWVASAVEAAGHTVKVLDLTFSTKPAAEIAEAIEQFAPEVIGLSVRNIDNSAGYNTHFFLGELKEEIIDVVKRAFSGPIVIGGPSVGVSGEEMLAFFDLEFAIKGDGEEAMVQFLARRHDESALRDCPGLVRWKNNELVLDSGPARSEDLDALPLPAPYKWVDIPRYTEWGSFLQVQSKRGCELSCTYCTYNKIEGKTWRLRSPESVVREIEDLVANTGVKNVEFTDSTFNFPTDHAKAVLRAVVPLSQRLGLRLRTMGLNPGGVDAELVALMKQAGFTEVDLGAESGNDRTLRTLGKNFRTDALERAATLLREANIAVTWYLLAGAPGETQETLQETFRTIDRLVSPWDFVNIGVGVRVYKGAPLAKKVLREDPNATGDAFLTPVSLTTDIELDLIKAIVKRHALTRTNYFMYDEAEEKAPLLAIKLSSQFCARFAPRQPIWRSFLILRRVQRWTGINSFLRLSHWWKTRPLFKKQHHLEVRGGDIDADSAAA